MPGGGLHNCAGASHSGAAGDGVHAGGGVVTDKGYISAVSSSGIRIMSDSLMPFQPRMEEPSNIRPSSKNDSSTLLAGMLTCCSLPRVSVKRISTQRASLSLIRPRVFDINASVCVASLKGLGVVNKGGHHAARWEVILASVQWHATRQGVDSKRYATVPKKRCARVKSARFRVSVMGGISSAPRWAVN